ncbi:hypothetical protein O1611_g2637 [Lasiodiplodia mahajangana]|uniref:Uncharacterized protein n=1 Tax=Lasiodiplodia mahajangana TaxID=1108764 RepID=A0ACC2JUW1_9PEZI|nr:hypothetical protein O1611_g2637 [Lasiodiplodia mahajangana]
MTSLRNTMSRYRLWPSWVMFSNMYQRIEDEACRVVFGSNLIENAGADFDYTAKICRQVFQGEDIDAANINEHSPDYAQLLQLCKQRGKEMNRLAVIHVQREIIQHAEAFSWAIGKMVVTASPWTEDVVRTIHRILYAGMSNDEVIPGQYRGAGHAIAAKYVDPLTGKEKTTRFIHPRAVRGHMAAWVDNLNRDIRRAEDGMPFDPYDLAAKHYHHFINIHPFGDGNGRTSRIILNCLVMRLNGDLIPIGENDEEKEEFLGIAVRGAKKYHEEEGEVHIDRQSGHQEMARLMTRKSVKLLDGAFETLYTLPHSIYE